MDCPSAAMMASLLVWISAFEMVETKDFHLAGLLEYAVADS